MSELRHVAIIMDGNGRWARKRGLPRVVGHRQGVETVRKIVKACRKQDIRFLTLYTFSTENWRRPEREVDTLMHMLEEMLKKEMHELHENNVRINAIGKINTLYPAAQRALQDAIELTKNNDELVLTLCLSYGGRGEIIDAVTKIVQQDRTEHIEPSQITEEFFSQFLYDPNLPDPDLLIRTGADQRERISNFLLWQIAYTELYFTSTLWPDFSDKEFKSALESFTERERLFGGVKRTEK